MERKEVEEGEGEEEQQEVEEGEGEEKQQDVEEGHLLLPDVLQAQVLQVQQAGEEVREGEEMREEKKEN